MKPVVPHQYKPFNHQIGDIPLIIYPVKWGQSLKDLVKNEDEIKQKLNKLYKLQSEDLEVGLYHIVFVWNFGGYFLTDVWIYRKAFFNSGYTETSLDFCRTYKDDSPYHDAGLASGNTIVTIGREQEHSWKFDSLEDYLDRSKSMPEFPPGFAPDEKF